MECLRSQNYFSAAHILSRKAENYKTRLSVGLLAEFRGLGVHVTRTTRRTKARAKVLLKLEFDTKNQVLSCMVMDYPVGNKD